MFSKNEALTIKYITTQNTSVPREETITQQRDQTHPLNPVGTTMGTNPGLCVFWCDALWNTQSSIRYSSQKDFIWTHQAFRSNFQKFQNFRIPVISEFQKIQRTKEQPKIPGGSDQTNPEGETLCRIYCLIS